MVGKVFAHSTQDVRAAPSGFRQALRHCYAKGGRLSAASIPSQQSTQAALDAGVWLRPFRDLVYVMPPYVTSPADVALICEGVAEAVTVA